MWESGHRIIITGCKSCGLRWVTDTGAPGQVTGKRGRRVKSAGASRTRCHKVVNFSVMIGSSPKDDGPHSTISSHVPGRTAPSRWACASSNQDGTITVNRAGWIFLMIVAGLQYFLFLPLIESVLITFIYLKNIGNAKLKLLEKIPSIFKLMSNAHLKYFLKKSILKVWFCNLWKLWGFSEEMVCSRQMIICALMLPQNRYGNGVI